MIVVDTNVLAYLLLPGPKTDLAETLRAQDRDWAAPPLWRSGYLCRDLLQQSAAVALMQEAEDILSAHEQPVPTTVSSSPSLRNWLFLWSRRVAPSWRRFRFWLSRCSTPPASADRAGNPLAALVP